MSKPRIERIAGSGITDSLDCNVYVIRGTAGSLLVDAGAGRAPLAIPTEVDTVVLTHLHADHAGGARALGQAGLRVLAHPWTAEGLMTGDEERSGLRRAREWGMFPPDQRLAPCPDVKPVSDGTRFDLGDCQVEVLFTPGHADGHLSLIVEGAQPDLIAGDLVFPGGTIALQVLPDCRVEQLWHSIERVRQLEPVGLYAGHGEPARREGSRHLDLALAPFRRGEIPAPHV